MSFGQRMGITGSCSLLPTPVPNGSLHISALLPSVRFTPGQTLPSWRPMSSRPTPPMLATTGQREFTIPSSYKESPNFLTCGSYPDLTIIVYRKIKIECSALVTWEQRQMWTLPGGPERKIKVLLPQEGEDHCASKNYRYHYTG